MRFVLLPLSWLYGLVVRLRNRLFDSRVLKSAAADVPVISVGNLTAGGTGKTPLVEYIAGHFLTQGRKVGIVSRGYGRASRGVVVVSDGSSLRADARAGGDEPVQMARKYPAAAVVVGEKRVEAARCAIELGAEVLLLDDAFQHRYLRRDVDILVLDSRKDIREEPLLPSGLRREPLSSLRRADLVVMSRIASRSVRVPWAPALGAEHI